MKKFYIASSFANAKQVNELRDLLVAAGWEQTHDWTRTDGITDDCATLALLKDVGVKDVLAVTRAEVVIALLPGGKGTHVELGCAIMGYSDLYIWAPTDSYFQVGKDTCPFYLHPRVMQRRDADIPTLVAYLTNLYDDVEG